MPVYVCGHKNTDTDSVVSAIVYSELESGREARVSGDLNKETLYVLDKFGVETPRVIDSSCEKVILVDHNSPEEMAIGLSAEKIVGIVDHHKLAGPFTPEPIEVFMKPYGSTSTIVALIAEEHGKELTKTQASLLLSGMVSDTFNFTSPTTTEKDKEAAKKINLKAGLDLDKLASELFEAKSDISDVKTTDLIVKDMKTFDFSGKKVAIGIWETVKPESIMVRASEIIEALQDYKANVGIDLAYFALVDILAGNSQFFLASSVEKGVAEEAFGQKAKGEILFVAGVVSRKKQIAPAFERYFTKG